MSLGRFTQWQFEADRNYELAIPHRFGHEFERFPVEFREYLRDFYRWVLRGILWCADDRCINSPRLDFGDQFFGRLSADSIRYRIERRKVCNRRVVVGCDELIRA